MLALAGVEADPAAVLASGAAYPVWERMIAAQGGDPAAPLPVASHVETVVADRSGVRRAGRVGGRDRGLAAGGGPGAQGAPVQAAAGVLLLVDPGESVEAGQPLLELHTDTPDAVPGARAALAGGVTVGADPTPRNPLVHETIR